MALDGTPRPVGDSHSMDTKEPITEADLQKLFSQALAKDKGIRLLHGFKPNLSGTMGVHKVFAAASCECGTAAVLGVEVEHSKSYHEVEEALPALVEQLRLREQAFRRMPCTAHAQMRSGGLATAQMKTPEVSEG